MLKCPLSELSGTRWTRGSITVSPRPCAARAASTAARISSSVSARRATSGPLRYVMSTDCITLLLRLDVGLADDLRPLAALGGDHLLEVLRRVAEGIEPQRRELLAHVRGRERLGHAGVELAHDGRRRSRAHDDAVPRGHVEAGKAALGDG